MPQSAAPSGLCASCAHARRVETGRGSSFVLCARWKDEARPDGSGRYPKYPRLPVVRCEGYERASADDVPRD